MIEVSSHVSINDNKRFYQLFTDVKNSFRTIRFQSPEEFCEICEVFATLDTVLYPDNRVLNDVLGNRLYIFPKTKYWIYGAEPVIDMERRLNRLFHATDHIKMSGYDTDYLLSVLDEDPDALFIRKGEWSEIQSEYHSRRWSEVKREYGIEYSWNMEEWNTIMDGANKNIYGFCGTKSNGRIGDYNVNELLQLYE